MKRIILGASPGYHKGDGVQVRVLEGYGIMAHASIDGGDAGHVTTVPWPDILAEAPPAELARAIAGHEGDLDVLEVWERLTEAHRHECRRRLTGALMERYARVNGLSADSITIAPVDPARLQRELAACRGPAIDPELLIASREALDQPVEVTDALVVREGEAGGLYGEVGPK